MRLVRETDSGVPTETDSPVPYRGSGETDSGVPYPGTGEADRQLCSLPWAW